MDPTLPPPRRFPSLPPPNPPLPPPADLAAAISHLKSLLSRAASTLSSLPFPSVSLRSPESPPLLPCPCNPHHLLPPESLYPHLLNCPSPLPALPAIPPPKPESETLQNHASFLPTCSEVDPATDFIFSLESEIGDLGSGFFYKDCPGVVTSVPDPAKSFTLPGFLLSECGLSATNDGDASSGKFATILPSEYWALRSEAEAWQSFPVSYSYTTLRAISGFIAISEWDLKKWVISNSPKYGIVIDVPVRDHIWFLLKICLKAVQREALCSLDRLLRNDGVFGPNFLSKCPKLEGSFLWLSNQLSILYGEVCARSFSLGMIREAVIKSGFRIMMNNSGKRDGQIDKLESSEMPNRSACSGNVLVSQVAHAIGALHHRAFLEGSIRALRPIQPVSKTHMLMEYAYVVSRAADERSKRSNYRPISDFDSLPSNRVQNQESGRAKTKEELLAEERDYKRRRASYRGKKVKRSPTEVLRDIIEEHMETIKQAGGIGPHQTNTGDASRLDDSQKSTTSDTYSFRNPPSPSQERSHKSGSRHRRENSADYYSTSFKESDGRFTEKDKRRDDTDRSSSRSYRGHEDRYVSKKRGRDHHRHRSEHVFPDTFDDRNDACENREEKRRNHRHDRSR